MDALQFWKQKVIQFFHDPVGKPFAFYPGSGGHKEMARALFERFSGLDKYWYNRRPDWAAAGADRPIVNPPKGPIQVKWPTRPILTHPLCTARLDARPTGVEKLSATGERDVIQQEQEAALDRLRGLEAERDPLADWRDADLLRRDYSRLWRRFRDELLAGREDKLLWAEMPADSRIPDHSIWDHLRVTTALAFLPSAEKRAGEAEDPQAPWLLRFTLHPLQRFVEEARSGRDLWVGSFLLADLTWHAMQPIVSRYGHDAILYPDLRGNPLVDNWLARQDDLADILSKQARNGAASYASLLPGAFTALVPYGAAGGHLLPLAELAAECKREVENRWRELAGLVHDWLLGQIGPGPWQAIWRRQHQQVIGCAWTAVAWQTMGKLKTAASLRAQALPAQDKALHAGRDLEDIEKIGLREQRLAPWLTAKDWKHYDMARDIYAHTNLDWHQLDRGYDYALTHHQLLTRHALRRAQAPVEGMEQDEPGEKCTCCGRRQALTGGSGGHIDGDRRAAREFWSQKPLDPDESGKERLCAVCAMKRFLIPAGEKGGRLAGLNPAWAGPDATLEQARDDDGKLRVPFPSTATIAAQRYIGAILTDAALASQVASVVASHQALGLPRTSFSRALPRLAALARQASAKEFLMREAEEMLFPEAIQGLAEGWEARGGTGKQALFEAHAENVRELRQATKKQGIAPPAKHIAVLAMDGDRIGRLLLGSEERIPATWKDVLHPHAVELMRENNQVKAAGWPDLLDAHRLVGPALHAYISRALAAFSHRVVPWVVEREFSGRLIYAGGDDLLCLVPGDEALDLAARLQQLFCAPWVIDNRPEEEAFGWRHRDGKHFEYDQADARRRFAIPDFSGTEPVRLPKNAQAIPLLGTGQTLSAGIAHAHYKTPLSRLAEQARGLLKNLAKDKAGRGAVAMSHASRNGTKAEFAMQWNDNAHANLKAVIQGFAKKGSLPGRLPYKLREDTGRLGLDFAEAEERNALARGLFRLALGEKEDSHPQREAAFALWRRGLELYPNEPERAVEGLLLCRALAGGEEESE